MAYSTQTVVSDGSLVLLDISIEYLERSEITVYFDSVLTTAWAWVGTTDKQITFSPAVPVGTVVLVKRTTDLSMLRHEFSLGAAFTAQSLDEDLKQVLQIAQEATEASLTGDFYAPIDMHGNGIANVADPVNAQDAVTKAWAEAGMTSQLMQAIAAKDSAVASASAASASELGAEAAAAAALVSQNSASASAAAALASENAAELAETNAELAEIGAAASAAAAAASYDSFDDRYLGPKAADPTLDNDGAALLIGALYFNTTLNEMRVYNGSAWELPAAFAASALRSENNLSDVANAATALSNIGGQPLDATLTAIADESIGALSHRNKIINGAMLVAQEGTSFSGVGPTVVKYPVDQFYYYAEAGGTGVVTVSQSTSAPNTNFNASAIVTVTNADASMAAGDAYLLRQTIEGYNVRDLIGNPFTLSFWVRSSVTGIHSISLSNGNNDRSYLAEYTINAANTWEFKTITVAGGLITAGTWDWTNGSGLRVTWSLGCGSTYSSATLGSWLTGAYLSSSNQVNCMGTVGNVFAITGVQLERGSVATPFEHRSYGDELARCQRYFEITALTLIGQVTGVTANAMYYAQKRAVPSIAAGGIHETSSMTDPIINLVTDNMAKGYANAGVAGAYRTQDFTVSARLI